MARTGQILQGPFTEVRFLETAADTNGARLVMEHRIQPGNASPTDHLHRHQVETFEVLAGRMWVRLRGEEKTLTVGDVVTVPKGTAHTFKNTGDEALHIRVTLSLRITPRRFSRRSRGSSAGVSSPASASPGRNCCRWRC